MKVRCLALATLLMAPTSARADDAPGVTVLKAARLFDGRGDATLASAVVIVEGASIKAVGSGLAIPSGPD